jgi:hypothetical protein
MLEPSPAALYQRTEIGIRPPASPSRRRYEPEAIGSIALTPRRVWESRTEDKGNRYSENINQLYTLYLLYPNLYFTPCALCLEPYAHFARNPQPITRNP